MNLYKKFKEKQQKEINDFNRTQGVFFAFDKKRFAEKMKELGLNETDTDKLCSLGGGGYIRKDKLDELKKLLEKQRHELKESFLNDDFAYEAFLYELGNHEFCITYDPDDALNALGLTTEDLRQDRRLMAIFQKAKSDYEKMVF